MRHRLASAPLVLLALVFAFGCSSSKPAQDNSEPAQREVDFTILQFNDVYEITPVEAGTRGGLARVATVRKRLLQENPNTLTLLPGDFISPSAIGTAKVDGERLNGKQMVAVLNTLGVDYVTFGNHEFDYDLDTFLARMSESEFKYVSGNVYDQDGHPFPGVEPYAIVKIPAASGDTLRMALLGVTVSLTGAQYVSYDDPVEVIRKQAVDLKTSGQADIVVAMTHLFLAQDIEIAEEVPDVDLILGGHDHENVQVWRGPHLTPITKADANVRSVYVHRLRYDFDTHELEDSPSLDLITDDIPSDPATKAVVDEWVGRAREGFAESGFDPDAVVGKISQPYDGRESVVRNQPTRLTKLILAGMRRTAGDVDVALFNSGSIRIDDVLPPGSVTQYDVIRVLPFGGDILTVEMTGGLLDSVLTQGVENKGEGGFLQVDGATQDGVMWRVGSDFVMPRQKYRVVMPEFLTLGIESGFEYLTFDDPRMTKVANHGDIRLAVIDELEQMNQ